MKTSALFASLLGLALVASCASQAPFTPANRGATLSQLNTRPQVAVNLNLADNFGAWIRQKQRDEGFTGEFPPVPIEGQRVAQLPTAGGSKALTYLSYEALDNNLFGDLNRVLDTLETVGSNAQMNLLAQTDSFGPGNTARYLLVQNSQLGQIVSPHIKLSDAAENSGDPRVLTDAVRWGFGTYPARLNWLNLSSHGLGYAGINSDDNPQANMNIVNFTQALKAGLAGKRLDIVSFDACLMATVEVGSELKDSANILVGSEDSTYYWGKGYGTTFARIAANPALSPEQIARSLVVDVNDKGASDQTLSISATDLRKLGELETELDKLARALRRLMPTQSANIIRAARSSKDFYLAAGTPYRDINRLLALLKQNVNDPEIAQLADSINHVMYRRGVILFSRQSKLQNDQGRGLSIYLPIEGEVSELYRQTRFAKSTQWDEFLLDMNKVIKATSGLAS